jgi:hypothetical protein
LLKAPEGRHYGSPEFQLRVFKIQFFFAPRWIFVKAANNIRRNSKDIRLKGRVPKRQMNIICRSEIIRGAK